MKQLLLLTGFLLTVQGTYAQTPFEDFVAMFPERTVTDPIFNITTNKTGDFLGASAIPDGLYNQVVFDDYQTPCYYEADGSTTSIDFIGRLDSEGIENIEYDNDGNETGSSFFYTKAYPLAKLNLDPNSITLLVSIRSIHAISLEVQNFDSSGKLLSALQLLQLESSPTNIEYDHPLYDFTIESDGKIFQKYDGLDFYRERRYELQADGHFKVVWENVVDR